MKQRFCLLCYKPIPKEKKLGTDFCCDAHRAKYWREHNPKPSPKPEIIAKGETTENIARSHEQLFSSLRGVIQQGDAPQTDPVKDEKSEPVNDVPNSDDPIAAMTKKKDALLEEHKNLIAQIRECEIQLKLIRGETGTGRISHYLFLEPHEKNKKSIEVENRKAVLERQAQSILNEWAKTLLQLPEMNGRKNGHAEIQLEKSPQQEKKTEEKIVEIKKHEEIKSIPLPSSFGDVVSSEELLKRKFHVLKFEGKWLEFIGQPSPVCHYVVHGKPGQGKSIFCFQLAVYLAQKFGMVAYLSAEEGIVKTLQDKLKLVNKDGKCIDVKFGAQKNIGEIKKGIPQNVYHFIILDSLDTMRIDAAGLKELREHYPNCAIISISQSTKSGSMRGSQEIIHDCDIEICVSGGVAQTKKNRFMVTGKTYRVFDDEDGATEKKEMPMEPPRNVV